MRDLVSASETMSDATDLLLPIMEVGGRSASDTMVIGTAKGDQYNTGKRIINPSSCEFQTRRIAAGL